MKPLDVVNLGIDDTFGVEIYTTVYIALNEGKTEQELKFTFNGKYPTLDNLTSVYFIDHIKNVDVEYEAKVAEEIYNKFESLIMEAYYD